MRSVILQLLVAATFANAATIECSRNNFEALISQSTCGCPKKLAQCLRTDFQFEEIHACFVSSGCKETDAILNASLFARECEKSDLQGELRRRADDDDDDEKTTAKTTAKGKTTTTKEETTEAETTSEKTTAKTTAQETTTAPATTEAATTTEPTSAETTESAESTSAESTSTPQSTTVTDKTTTRVTAASQVGTTSEKLVCSTTIDVTTSACFSVGPKKSSCTPTVTPSASCAPGIICMDEEDVCMKRDNHLTTSGLVVTIIFAVGIVGVLVAIILAQRQSSKANAQAKADAGKGYGSSDIEATNLPYGQANASDAHVPLIPEGAPRPEHGQYGGGYTDSRQNARLGALGQD